MREKIDMLKCSFIIGSGEGIYASFFLSKKKQMKNTEALYVPSAMGVGDVKPDKY